MIEIDAILKQLAERRGSDLHLKVDRPPLFRISSELLPTEHPPLTTEDLQAVIIKLLGESGFKKLQEEWEVDASYLLPEVGRFRINAFRRMGQYGAVMRLIPLTIPTIDGLGLPPVLKDIVAAPQGMVLVTGPTGSGKSTTLASMVNHLNETQPLHIITVEDPIEFVYTDKMSTFNQRQLGNDVKNLHEALKRILRQDPDVIMIGEMRDRETVEMAMHAAETGHLVFSTLHTNDAKQTLDRIVDIFPREGAHQVRAMLALTLQAVVSQRLIRRADGVGRVAAMEILINSGNIRELIAQGKTNEIDKAIEKAGAYYRMQTFNQSMAGLVKYNLITEEEAMSNSTAPGDLRLLLRGVQSGSANMPPASTPPASETAKDSSKLKISRGY